METTPLAPTARRSLPAALLALALALVGLTAAPPAAASTPSVRYAAHVQDVGWQGEVADGRTAGTSGRSLRVEALKIRLVGAPAGSGVVYSTHVQDVGWQAEVASGAVAGTTGRSLRVEAVRIRLTGPVAATHELRYRAHVQNVGWQAEVASGAVAGTSGRSLRVEALEIRLVPKQAPTVAYSAHVQNVGWQGDVVGGATAGTTGRSLRVEALRARLVGGTESGSLTYTAHVQDVGWQPQVRDGAVAGTSGRGLRVEAVRFDLTGDIGRAWDVCYRVHAQNFGWMSWACNGQSAGTQGFGYRVEAVQVTIVPARSVMPSVGAYRAKGAAYQTPGGYLRTSVAGFPTSTHNGAIPYSVPTLLVDRSSTRLEHIEALVAHSRLYEGIPYERDSRRSNVNQPWNGTDCSGLVVQSLLAAGLDVRGNDAGSRGRWYRSSQQLYDRPGLLHVPLAQRQRGDLVFYQQNGRIYHVAVYLGDGMMMEEDSTWGGGGRITKLRTGGGLTADVVRPFP
ncbi:NlpC/P60 family protein [Xylanimonas oleitrophica]|nr:NlpC/P60 family protein [Xylanimonas oleitrophica]